MLVHLSIRYFAIIEQLDIALTEGMTVITGETGAGKSIMLDALGLALGDRAGSGVVHPDSDKAEIAATFDISHSLQAQQWLSEQDLMRDEGLCLIRRVITTDGRSRAYINGSPSPLGHLKTLGDFLIDLHSQHEHQSLLKSDTQRQLLDNFAQAQGVAKEVRQYAIDWQRIEQTLSARRSTSEAEQAHLDLLRYQLSELEQHDCSPAALAALENAHQQQSQAKALIDSAQSALRLCQEQESANVLSFLNTSMHSLERYSNNSSLQEAQHLLASARIHTEEAVQVLTRFLDQFEADPAHLQKLAEQLDTLYSLARKHRVQPDALEALTTNLRAQLSDSAHSNTQIEHLEAERNRLQQLYQERAGVLSERRKEAAKALSTAIQTQMQRLGMAGGQFQIVLTQTTDNQPRTEGAEHISFQVSANPGQALQPLVKVASGGELSRISLAIQVITAQTSTTPTLVFDEVDVGIGGPTAEVVGQLLRQLGTRGQVFVVTHLAQVAALGHQHFVVHKETGATTKTKITNLAQEARVREIARMLGGIDLTPESEAHARKLLSMAQH